MKGVVTSDIVGRPTEIRFFYKQAESENYVVYFPNFNLTMRDPGNYGELAMITLPKYVQARFVILGIVSFMDNACLKVELMGCDEPAVEPLLGYDYGYSPCVGKLNPTKKSSTQIHMETIYNMFTDFSFDFFQIMSLQCSKTALNNL